MDINITTSADDFLRKQTAIPLYDPVVIWAQKTLAKAENLGFRPLEIRVYNEYEYCKDDLSFSQLIMFVFPILPRSEIKYYIARQAKDDEPWIWCGPSHFPASDETIEDYLVWIETAIDLERLNKI